MTVQYFYCVHGYKDGSLKKTSGIYDFYTKSEEAFKVKDLWQSIQEWLKAEKEFDGNFTIIAFNKV